MTWKLVVLVVSAMTLVGVAMAAGGGGSGKVTLCAAKKGGSLELGKRGKCGKGERKVTIAKRGPTGPQGPAGKDGTPADVAPEPLRLVGAAVPQCAQQPGTFCPNGLGPNWENRDGGYAPTGFRKDAGGFVHLQGVVTQAGSGATTDGVAFYLPPGYRPADGTHVFRVSSTDGGTATRAEVRTDGAVYVNAFCCASLDGIVFHP